jgi:uncharacterized protein YidB (DUF937 family)
MGLLDVLGGGTRRSGGMSPITMALLGVLAYRTMKGKGRLADMLGTGQPAGANPYSGQPGGANPYGGNAGGPDPRAVGGGPGGGGLGGLLGGLLGGGAAGGLLSGGLQDLLKQFQTHGQGDKAQSWIEKGPNKPIRPEQLEQALGEERIAWLIQETGLSRQELLAGLSRELPQAVDKLTPDGRVPTEQEAARMV